MMLRPEPKFLFDFLWDPTWEEDEYNPEDLWDEEEDAASN